MKSFGIAEAMMLAVLAATGSQAQTNGQQAPQAPDAAECAVKAEKAKQAYIDSLPPNKQPKKRLFGTILPGSEERAMATEVVNRTYQSCINGDNPTLGSRRSAARRLVVQARSLTSMMT
jgi:hypothetical protein